MRRKNLAMGAGEALVAQQLMVRGLIERGDGAALVLTDQGRSVLEVLMTTNRQRRQPHRRQSLKQ